MLLDRKPRSLRGGGIEIESVQSYHMLDNPEFPPYYAPAGDATEEFDLEYTNLVVTLYQRVNRVPIIDPLHIV